MKKLSPNVQRRIEQIQEMAQRREDYIRKNGQPLPLQYICNKLGIYRSTVKKLAPELYENWNDINYHWI